jgi:hypothetical protein
MSDVYRRFMKIWADGVPIVDESLLAVAIDAQALSPGDVTDDWLRALDSDWVHFRGNQPFRDPLLNQRYLRLAAVMHR